MLPVRSCGQLSRPSPIQCLEGWCLAARSGCTVKHLWMVQCHKELPQLRRRLSLKAKRVSKEEAAAGEWAALLSYGKDSSSAEGVTVEELNKICNKGLKLMLNEDRQGLMDFQDELNIIGQHFSEKEDKDGALFVYVLWKMCDHVIVDQAELLQGIYHDAFRKVFDILEDSGWSLGREDEEKDDIGLDDIPNLSYMQ